MDDVGRVLVGVLEPLRVRDDLLVDELAHGFQDRALDVGETRRLGQSGHAATSVLSGNLPSAQYRRNARRRQGGHSLHAV
jgi:hypothetical protein